MLVNLVIFLAVLSLLVLVHELGHFLLGRKLGIGVIEFALGLPFTRPLVSKKLRGGMKVSLYPLLFGGFVNLLGEERRESETHRVEAVEGQLFYKKSAPERFAVVAAGVSMNFLLAVAAFYFFLTISGFKVLIPKITEYRFLSGSQPAVVVTGVQKDSPAEHAGLAPSDVVLLVNGEKFLGISQFQDYIKTHTGTPINLTIADLELNPSKKLVVVPRIDPPAGQGAMGVSIAEATAITYSGFGQRVTSGLAYTLDMLFYNLKVIKHLVLLSLEKKDVAPLSENISGPIGIFSAVGEIVGVGGRQAALALVNFVGLLSLSLVVMNLIPFPALDGGRLLLLLMEGLTGKKLSAKKERWVNQVGMAFLMGLIVLISYNDILKIVSR